MSDRTQLNLRATRAWLDWLHRLSAHCGHGVATTLDRALRDYAGRAGFDEPPPRRTRVAHHDPRPAAGPLSR